MTKQVPEDEQLCILVKHLFRTYCVEHDVDTEQMRLVTMELLYDWYREGSLDLSVDTEPRQEICEQLGISTDVCEFLHEVLQNPFHTARVLWPIWPLLCFSGNAPPRHKVQRIELVHRVVFTDGKEFALTGKSVGEEKEPLNDGMLASLFRGHSTAMSMHIGSIGVDALYDKYAEEPLDVQAARQRIAQAKAAQAPSLWLPGQP